VLEEQVEPTGREAAAAVEVEVAVLADVGAALEAVVVALKPLQKPWLQVLKAHWESSLQVAWKFPQAGMRPELTA
jgi:hypothetical protein